MRIVVAIIAFFAAQAALASAASRPIIIRGWTFDVPSFLRQDIHEGPDFTVTYFSSKEKRAVLGIYDGFAPQEFSAGRPGVRREKWSVCEQEGTWALWEEVTDGSKIYHAELFVLIDPASKQHEKFHIFASASSSTDLDELRLVIRTARRQKANQTPEPTALLVTPRAGARVAPSKAVAHL